VLTAAVLLPTGPPACWRAAAAGVGGSYPSALNDLANGKSTVMPTRSAAKLENLAALEMPFELKALEVCLDSVSLAAELGLPLRLCGTKGRG
jgi:hypothetical protein